MEEHCNHWALPKMSGGKEMRVSLTDLKSGTEGVIAGIDGGRGMISKLEALGIRIGVRIKKISTQFMRGPVIVQVGNTQVAIGYGMARRVFVER